MKQSPINKALPLLADGSFALYLAAELIFAHSLISQICMLFFFGVAAAYCIRRKRLYFTWWFVSLALFLLWGLVVTLGWAIDSAASMVMVKTLVVNLVFVFFLFQYLMLQGDTRRYMAAFAVVVTVISLYAFVRELPYDIHLSRVGTSAGINPNRLGALAAFSTGFCLILAKRKKIYWLLPLAVLLPVVLLSKSTLAAVMAAVMVCGGYLVLYPKRWWLKLAVLLAATAAGLYFIVYLDNPLSSGILNRVHAMARYYVDGSDTSSSAGIRRGYIDLALRMFRERPLGGYGFRSFRLFEGADETYAHNNFAELIVSGGWVMLAMYYLPQIAAFVLAARTAVRFRRGKAVSDETKARANLDFFMLLVPAQVLMDYGSVSYYERVLAVAPLLLIVATRLYRKQDEDGTRFFAFLKNPYRLFVMLTHHGFFKRMDDERYLRLLYRGVIGRELCLDPPLTYNEKIQWLKLHDKNPLYPQLCDKIAVREFVRKRAGERYFVPILGVWDDPRDIDFSSLPQQFVLKCTHDSGGVIICTDKSALDVESARRTLKKRLSRDYSRLGREWPYQMVPRRVLAEAFIGNEDGALPDDYKFYCVRGRVLWSCLCTNRHKSGADYIVYDAEEQPIWTNIRSARLEQLALLRSPHYAQMLELAARLSEGLTHVRVDLYDTPDGVRFGEITLYDQSGFIDAYCDEFDRKLGGLLDLSGELASVEL